MAALCVLRGGAGAGGGLFLCPVVQGQGMVPATPPPHRGAHIPEHTGIVTGPFWTQVSPSQKRRTEPHYHSLDNGSREAREKMLKDGPVSLQNTHTFTFNPRHGVCRPPAVVCTT